MHITTVVIGRQKFPTVSHLVLSECKTGKPGYRAGNSSFTILICFSFLRYGSKLSEFFLLEYASSLIAHPSLWQVAMGYLSECPLQGRHYMEAYIERVPVESERKACKVLRLCEKYQLREQGRSVSEVDYRTWDCPW